jgi:transcription-repair coupling factor (superfamily II helicase)
MSSLSALRSHVAALPGTQRLQEALSVPGAEVAATAPPGARSALIAALAAAASDRAATTPVLAVTATTREADDLAAALAASLGSALVVGLFPSWETLPHERLSPATTPSVAPGRAASPRPPGRARPRRGRALAVVVAPVRAVLQPIARGLGDLTPSRSPPATSAPWSGWSRTSSAAAYAAPTSSSGAASSRSAAASSTSSRRPRNTRCASSSGETRSRRSGGSGSPTSAASRWPRVACGPRRAASAAHRRRSRAGPRLATRLPGVADLLEKVADGIAVEGMESLQPVLVDGHADPARRAAPGLAHRPGRPRTGPHPRPRPRGHERGVPRGQLVQRRAGNAVPIDLRSVLGEGSYRTLAGLRQDAITRVCRGGPSPPSLRCRADGLPRRRSEQRLGLGSA